MDITDDAAKKVVVEMLTTYVNGSRGAFQSDLDYPNIYWLKIWINGNLLMRNLKLSDCVKIRIDLDEVTSISGQEDNFVIQFRNGSMIKCDDNITIL